MTTKILIGDCRDVLKTLPDQSVNCCVTSPPYWGLRSYLPADHPNKHREIGSEPTVEQWVQTMVEVFREVRRVLRDDGTLWLNLGDSYAGNRGAAWGPSESSKEARALIASARRDDHPIPRSDLRTEGCKPKDLVGQPWLVAFALRADGWYWRDTIVWHKKNPMPESVDDRCTKAWEPVLMFSKSPRYYFDAEAIKEPASENTHARLPGNKAHTAAGLYEQGDEQHRTKGGLVKYAERQRERASAGARMGREPGWRKLATAGVGTKNNGSFDEAMAVMPERANKRNVWTLASEPFKEAHFATFPPSLIEPCVLAGCPEAGTVLDPFGGSGTTGLVADRNGRDAILIDLDERNEPMADRRIQADKWNADKRTPSLFADVEVQA